MDKFPTMKLIKLEPHWMKRVNAREFQDVDSIQEADGIRFLCPKCFADKGNKIGVHSCICWAPSVPQDTSPTPGRWDLVGTSFDDLTLVAGSSSILLTSGCMAHFFIRNGEVQDA